MTIPYSFDWLPQGLQQHNIVVHGIYPLHRIPFQVKEFSQVAVGQLDHNG